jgi:nicotinate-nucleotide adenylyltransferase
VTDTSAREVPVAAEMRPTGLDESPASVESPARGEHSPPQQPRAHRRSTTGILGGTFNPPHRGHLALARHARDELRLDRVLLMPAHGAPHKTDAEDPGPQRRLEMCRLAVRGETGLQVSGLELERGGPSYTVDTLRAVRQSDPEAELTFIVGADMARTLATWREPRELVELARLAVAEREDTGREDVLGALDPLGARVEFLGMGMFDVSSSQVRERVRHGEPIDGLLAPAVAEYIVEHGLYGAAVVAE